MVVRPARLDLLQGSALRLEIAPSARVECCDSFASMVQDVLTADDERISISYTCPWCLERTHGDGSSCRETRREEYEEAAVFIGFTIEGVVVCGHAGCGRGSLFIVKSDAIDLKRLQGRVEVTIYPRAIVPFIAEAVPGDVAADMTEALACFAHGYNVAAAVVGRRALQRAVRLKLDEVNPSLKEAGLRDEIESLPETVLSSQWKQAAHHVRLTGNDAAHADPIEKEDADQLLEFASSIFNQIFTMPARIKTATASRPIPPLSKKNKP